MLKPFAVNMHDLTGGVKLSDLDLSRHFDVGRQLDAMRMADLYERGGRPQRNPVAEHDAAFRKAIAFVGHEIDPNNLPRVNVDRLRFSDLETTFLWGPGGEWTGFVRIASAFEDTERRISHYMARESRGRRAAPFDVPVESRYGTFVFRGWCMVQEAWRVELPKVDSVLLFKDYEEQASYAALVEDRR